MLYAYFGLIGDPFLITSNYPYCDNRLGDFSISLSTNSVGKRKARPPLQGRPGVF
jgi:hypothetical protein